MEAEQVSRLGGLIEENIKKVVIGNDENIRLLICCALAGGHALLEDVPGTGKTVMARAFSRSVGGRFSRVQFTPDLLPQDITGTRVFRQDTGEFVFHFGPVFANVLLADEINRATPRTQSALLECMQEAQVTEGGTTYPLPEPFLVVATQNPVEIQGTFPLPEAQLDRFLMRITPGYPDHAHSLELMDRFLTGDPLRTLEPVCTPAELLGARECLSECRVDVDVRSQIAQICEYTRRDERVQLGVSPRGMLALLRACQAMALLSGRTYVTPDDVLSLAVPVLAHRVIARGYQYQGDMGTRVVRDALKAVPVPTEKR